MTATIEGAWTASSSGGNLQNQSWRSNPVYLLRVSAAETIVFNLTQPDGDDLPAAGLLVLRLNEGEALPTFPTEAQKIGGSTFRSSALTDWRVDVTPSAGRVLLVLAMTAEAGHTGSFTLTAKAESGSEVALESFQPSRTPLATATAAAGAVAGAFAVAKSADADGDGMVDETHTASFVAVLPSGLGPFAGWDADESLQEARIAAQQQGDEGYTDESFAAQVVNAQTRKKESNAKILYVSGQPPTGASSSSKVDTWTRLKDFAQPASETGSQIHLRPAALDDTWLLCAIGMVSTRPDLMQRLHSGDAAGLGVHGVRLFKDGEAKGVAPVFTSVVVDDLMPCHGKKKLIYSSNVDPTAGPVAVVQKALAKLYGCYEHLVGGRVGGALEDLTGGIADKLYLRDGVKGSDGSNKQGQLDVGVELRSGQLWKRLHALHEAGHLLGAAYKPKYAQLGGSLGLGADSNALALSEAAKKAVEGKAAAGSAEAAVVKKPTVLVYPIVELRDVEGAKFVKLHNPWHKVGDAPAPEYKGEWSKESPLWQNAPALASALGGKPKGHTFWMPFEGFLAAFNKVNICYLPRAPSNAYVTVEGEWTASSGGGRLSAAPSAKWRDNPQYKIKVKQRCTVLIALGQQDSQTDANDASDAYPSAIGFHIIRGPDRGQRRAMDLTAGQHSCRFAHTRRVCRAFELEPTDGENSYTLMPATWEPNVYMPFAFTIVSSGPIEVTPIDSKSDYTVSHLVGSWSVASKTAGGCPNFTESWTQNPQITFSTELGGAVGVAVLSLQLPEAELTKKRLEEHEKAEKGDTAGVMALGLLCLKANAEGAPAYTGVHALPADRIVAKSAFVQAVDEQATLSLQLPPGRGTYVLVPCTFAPGFQSSFNLTLYIEDENSAINETIKPVKGARLLLPKSEDGAKKETGANLAPPVSKHDLTLVRQKVAAKTAAKYAEAAAGTPAAAEGVGEKDELGDDGKMGYAQRMEMEEELKLLTTPENVPLFTVEGAPLSKNVKDLKDRLIKQALDQCARTGQKFEDSGPGGFPVAPGRARSDKGHQPQVYNEEGYNNSGMPNVVDWRRPEEFAEHPVMFQNDYSVEGIIQAAGFDNRWFISALNIVSGNRGQLDRVFFGELDDTWKEKGFFVCKFYKDDPLSDDDWQVVIVDDRIPCDANGQPAFCRSPDPNVYWAMIIEKAYAKYAGCYESMQGGTVVQGLEELTGGIGYKFDLEKKEKEWVPPKGSDPDKLWHEIMEKMSTEHVIGCANNTKGQDRPQTTKRGLLLNRAYAIVTGGEFEDNRLLRLRVPLNEDGTAVEWNGRWSDNSPQWNNRLRQMLAYGSDSEDGCFWMEYKDLARHFNKVYMCRMLDDLWTRVAVRSRWMDETAGGCTNFISWRNNNQWLLTITRPNTKLVIKLTQPDARKASGNGRHYSNAIGFYILKGNTPNAAGDHKRRKLIAKDGDEEDGGDFVFCKGPRFSKQVLAEYTFEKASETPYVLMPFVFEPGREMLFRFTLLSDDRDDDGEPDFFFSNIKPEEDWKQACIKDAWHKGGKGNQFLKYNLPYQGSGATAGGAVPGGPVPSSATWSKNSQFQISLSQPTRIFAFLEARNVKMDMRDVEGLQTEPAYPTCGFVLCRGKGQHVLLEGGELEVLYKSDVKKADGVSLELGALPVEPGTYVLIPFTDQPGVEHEFALTLYTDYDVVFEKTDPSKLIKLDYCGAPLWCADPGAFAKVTKQLKRLEAKYAQLAEKEALLKARGGFGRPKALASAAPAPAPPPPVPEEDEWSKKYGQRLDPSAFKAFGAGFAPAAYVDPAYREHLDAMDSKRAGLVKREGFFTVSDLKQATLAVEDQTERERREYEEKYREQQRKLARDRAELASLMAMLQQAQGAKRVKSAATASSCLRQGTKSPSRVRGMAAAAAAARHGEAAQGGAAGALPGAATRG